ncbi:hypothetical protein [Mesorhizobium sp. M5C.F.Ca.ET.164.01.1.1]|uniref:hypothetical protein n=1 Tax=Mesorhizobium sp. M5C.F.Ca.ET.164.01.1.1 TaxID=2563957 RepID=UPI001093D78D|nr:hypothetical protein [Mesorhizobium sp. M5C.F.Ca.ET.164.01.1.1]TGU01278.1 hypothetical protein EN807_16495 [Mesorhizobium sp. M5C.F.Ca.ET.164.01.1.1]
MTISRRTLIAAIAALPASAGPGHASAAPEAPDTAPPRSALPDGLSAAEISRHHLEAFKAAAQAADPTITGWSRVVPEYDSDYAFMIIAQRSRRR